MFQMTPFYRVGENVVFGLMRPPVEPADTDTRYKVSAGFERRLDLIASAVYGKPAYWWAIAMANNIDDPQEALPIGTVLRIPALSAISNLS